MAENPSPRENVELEHKIDVVPVEQLEAEAEAGSLKVPETLGSVLLDAAAPGVDAAVGVVAEGAAAQSDAAEPGTAVEGAIPLSHIDVPRRNVNFKLEKIVISEQEAKGLVAELPKGSFYKKNPLDPRPGYRVYRAV